MKNLLIVASLFLIGCEKNWSCEIITPGLENPYYYEFKGTAKEMKEFENSPTYPGQTVNCTK